MELGLYEVLAYLITFGLGLLVAKFTFARTAMLIIKALADGKITSDELKAIVDSIRNPK